MKNSETYNCPPPPVTGRERVLTESEAAKQLSRGLGETCHCEEAKPTSQSQNLQNFTIMRLLLASHNDVHVNHLLTYLPTNLLTSKKRKAKAAFTLAEGVKDAFHLRQHKCAFTLAEVLITLTIIGVVAAMTMPSLIAKYQEKQTVTALKKFYSVISLAHMQAVNEYGSADLWGTNIPSWVSGKSAANILEKYAKFIKLAQNCGTNNGCMPHVIYTYMDGSTTTLKYMQYPDEFENIAKAVTVDGMPFYIYAYGDCNTNIGNLKNICGDIHIDVNGSKGPNSYGHDRFLFYITKDKIFPVGTAEENNVFNEKCSKTNEGSGCAAWVIYNENLDYLHCDDLSWTGKTKCK